MLHFIKNVVIGQKKRYLLVAAVLTVLFSFDFSLLVMLMNIPNDIDSLSPLIISILIMIVMIISFVLMVFINNFFIMEKSDEFSIILLSGRNVLQICKYISLQFGTLFIVTATIGSLLGNLIVNIMNYIFVIFDLFEIFKINTLSLIYFYFIALLMIKLCFLFIVDFGKFMDIKFRIVEYMNHIPKNKTQVSYFSSFKVEKEEKTFPIFHFLIVLLTLFIILSSIWHIVIINDFTSLLIYFISALICLVVFVRYFISLFFDLFHNRWLLKYPKTLMAMSQLIYLLKIMSPLIMINSLLTPFMFYLIAMPSSDLYLLEITISCYFILLVMLIICYIFRFSLYLPSKSRDIATLKAIGYQLKEINLIHLLEILLFLGLSALLPFIIYITVVWKGYALLFISGKMVSTLVCCYFLAYLLIGGYMLYSYYGLTRKVIKNVKYLNRSE